MNIPIEVLRAALDKLLDHVKETQGEPIDIDPAPYWFVQKESLYDPAADPRELTLTLGALDDDWSQIEAIGNGAKEPIGYALVWASALLRAIGDRVP